MTNINSKLRMVTIAGCVSAVALLAACGTPDGGYYDKNGNYVPTDTPYNMRTNAHSPMPGGNPDYLADREDNNREYPRFKRRGYYDYNGYYIARDSGLTVPSDMFPPRGMCRVWFVDRMVDEQPGIESCDGIRYRVPAGAYVIYGG